VTLAVESKTEWKLLQEHLRGDPMWTSLTIWRRALAAYIEPRVNFEAKCMELVTRKIGYKLAEQSHEPPFLYSHSVLNLMYQAVVDRTPGVEQKTTFEDMITVNNRSGEVRDRSGTILADAPGEEERCKANILAALNELLESAEAVKTRQAHKELEGATTKARQSLEEVLLFEVVPGECRVCRRFGT
jgi:hypothetical protein